MKDTTSVTSPIPVAIVGAGPVGLSLALGLARQGIRSLLLERNDTTSEYSRAPGIHVRTREVFRQWNIEQAFLEAGTLLQKLTLHSTVPGSRPLYEVDFTGLENEADRPGLLVLEQSHTERLLLEAVKESGLCDVRFGAEAVSLEQEESGVRLAFREAEAEHTVEAGFVIGCDGAGSFVRKALELPFEGATYSLRPVLADVRINDARDKLPWPRMWNGTQGLTTSVRLSHGLWRIISIYRSESADGETVPDHQVADMVTRVLGRGYAEVVWASRFQIHVRSAPRFRSARVLLAGDAAHLHSPVGGFGMNSGIQDAHNLAWKLATALRSGEAERLLDSYETERKAIVVHRVSPYTDLLTRTFLNSPRVFRRAAFVLLRLMLHIPFLRRMSLRRNTMLDLDYPSSPILDLGVRSAGVRLPNPVLRAPDGSMIRLYDILPYAPAILHVAEGRGANHDFPVANVIRIGSCGYQDSSGVIRNLAGGQHRLILVRPDAHIAWTGNCREGFAEVMRYSLGENP